MPALRKQLVIGGFLGAATVTGFSIAVASSESIRHCVNPQTHGKASLDTLQGSHWVHVPASCIAAFISDNDKPIVALATVGLLIVTFGLALYTARLWKATVDLAREAKTSAEAQGRRTDQSIREAARAADAMDAQVRKTDQIGRQQLRAYIGVHALALKDLPVTGVASTGGIEIKNYGQTPAHDVQIGFMVAITRFPHDQKDVMPPFVDEPTDPKNGFVLDPTESRKAYHQIPAFDINETKAIADGRIAGTGNEVRLCMRGYVSYADVFGVDHVRLFCHFFGGPESKQPSYCMIHNTASQEELANILGNQRDK